MEKVSEVEGALAEVRMFEQDCEGVDFTLLLKWVLAVGGKLNRGGVCRMGGFEMGLVGFELSEELDGGWWVKD